MEFIRGIYFKAKYKIFHMPLDISVLSILRGWFIIEGNNVGHLHCFCKETAIATFMGCGHKMIDSFYTRAFDAVPAISLNAKVARLPNKLLLNLAPDLMVKTLGCCSLLVLAQ